MSNNQSPFSYVPVTNLTTPPNNQLRHIRLLPAVWNQNAPLPDWAKIQQTINLNALKKNRIDYWRLMTYDFELKILRNDKINQENKDLLQNLFFNYYRSVLSPSIYGVYLDGKALIDEVAQSSDNKKTTKLLTRYADAMTAASMFGVLSAHNNRKQGKLNNKVFAAKDAFLDICALPIESNFNPTAPYADDAQLAGLQKPLVYFPFEQIKAEVTRSFDQTMADELDFVNDLTNAKTADLPTIIPEYWLNVFNNKLKDVDRNENNHGLYLGKK